MSEPPDLLDYNWGGDGSNLFEPVRAHVEAALVPTEAPYAPPLDTLLELGDPDEPGVDEELAALGLTQEDVPELIRMARDRALNTAPSDSDEVWAPIHALRALESLDVDAVAGQLTPLFDVDSEWFGEGLDDVFQNAGAGALEALGRYIQDTARWISGHNYAIEAFGSLAANHPELRDRAVELLSDILERASENDESINGIVVGRLIDLDAAEKLPLLRRAFEQDSVDESIAGDWGEVLEQFGEIPDPADPLVARSLRARQARDAAMFGGTRPAYQAPPPPSTPPAPKKAKPDKLKAKRKISKASRKTNKVKKKRK
jgi:hypothetical protein